MATYFLPCRECGVNSFAAKPALYAAPPCYGSVMRSFSAPVRRDGPMGAERVLKYGLLLLLGMAPDSRPTKGFMSRLEFRLPLLVVFLGCPVLGLAQAGQAPPQASQTAKPSTSKSHSKKSTKAEEPPLPPYVAAPLSQLPLEEMPAIPPQVLFQDGQLTIVSENSTLVDILREVRKQTGADFDVPSGATERVVTAIGPGPARDVLATLLNGTHFNYVMVGSTSDPTVLERVVLTPKPTAGVEMAAANGVTAPREGFRPAGAHRMAVAQPAESADDDDDDADPQMAAGQPDSQPEQQAAASAQAGTETATPQSANGVNTPPGPKTPEQLLQELQQRTQIRGQLQQQPSSPQQQ